MYIQVLNNTARHYSIPQLRADNPQVSFPIMPSNTLLASYGVYEAAETARPAYDHTKNVSETFQQIDGVWTQVWVESPASEAEISARVTERWFDVRAERNSRLAACDWTQLADATVDAAAWAAYRQALRDLPQTQADPFNIVWPTSP